jgi:hypothetical protein
MLGISMAVFDFIRIGAIFYDLLSGAMALGLKRKRFFLFTRKAKVKRK